MVSERRRKSSHKPLVLSEACKQLLIYRLPQVLRLHLKRFRQVSVKADIYIYIFFFTSKPRSLKFLKEISGFPVVLILFFCLRCELGVLDLYLFFL